jgi:hypothetical protein
MSGPCRRTNAIQKITIPGLVAFTLRHKTFTGTKKPVIVPAPSAKNTRETKNPAVARAGLIRKHHLVIKNGLFLLKTSHKGSKISSVIKRISHG